MRVVAALFSALAVAACLAPSKLFVTSLNGGLLAHDLAVTLEDRTGLVQAFGPAQPGQFNLVDGIKADADPSVLVLTWLGGACDRSTQLVFSSRDGRYVVTSTTQRADLCTLEGFLRTVSIGLSSPV